MKFRKIIFYYSDISPHYAAAPSGSRGLGVQLVYSSAILAHIRVEKVEGPGLMGIKGMWEGGEAAEPHGKSIRVA